MKVKVPVALMERKQRKRRARRKKRLVGNIAMVVEYMYGIGEKP